jgi:hypothetical protein
MADVVHVHAPDLTEAASTVAQHMQTAAKTPAAAAPLPAAASPADVAASGAAGAIQTKMAALSTELAPKGPAIQQAGAGAAAALQAQDTTNASRISSVQTEPPPPRAGKSNIQAVDRTWKQDPPPPPPSPGGPRSGPPKPPAGDAAADAARRYDQARRAADQAIVDKAEKDGRNSYLPSMEGQPGYMSREESDAADRLRDYKAITNPASGADVRRLAGERLDDYNQSKFVGPLTKDTVLGADARTRAQARLQLQHDLENGNTSLDVPHYMTPDQATQMVDGMEATDRANVLTRLQQQLQAGGMSPAGAAQVAEGYAHGVIPQEYIDAASAAGKPFDAGKEALSNATDLLDHGRHWAPEVGAFSPDDIATLQKVAGRIGGVGSALEFGTGFYEMFVEGKSPLEVGAKAAGGVAGTWTGIETGTPLGAAIAGPPGAFIGALLLGTLGGLGGDWMGGRAYQWLTE